MSNTSSNDATSMEARVTQAGEAIGEHVKSATAATAAAAGHAQKVIEDAAAATVAAASQGRKVLRDAGDAAQLAWSQAGGVVEDVVDAGRRATKSVSQQIQERPLMVALIGFALGYVASLWIQCGSGRPVRIADDSANAKPLPHRR
jgi:hypothetical protein